MRQYISDNAWTLAGTGLVLITLSGQTRMLGVIISGIAVVLQGITYLIKDKDT